MMELVHPKCVILVCSKCLFVPHHHSWGWSWWICHIQGAADGSCSWGAWWSTWLQKGEIETSYSMNNRITNVWIIESQNKMVWVGRAQRPSSPTSHLDQTAPSPIQTGPDRPRRALELNQELLPWGVSSKGPPISFLPRGEGANSLKWASFLQWTPRISAFCAVSPSLFHIPADGRGKQWHPQPCTPSWQQFRVTPHRAHRAAAAQWKPPARRMRDVPCTSPLQVCSAGATKLLCLGCGGILQHPRLASLSCFVVLMCSNNLSGLIFPQGIQSRGGECRDVSV